MRRRSRFKSLDKLLVPGLVLALELNLDSIQLQLHDRAKKPNYKRIRQQVLLCLGISRRLQFKFPQVDYTLNRCHYSDELPGRPMGPAKRDWRIYKRKQKGAREQRTLELGDRGEVG